jgi:hypothetical protein
MQIYKKLSLFLFLSPSIFQSKYFPLSLPICHSYVCIFSPCLFHFNSLSLLPLSSFVLISFIYLSLLPLSSSLSLFLASIFLSSPSTPLYPYFLHLSFSPPPSLSSLINYNFLSFAYKLPFHRILDSQNQK